MVFLIEKFSSSLCLAFATDQGSGRLPIQCFELTDDSKDIQALIHRLRKIFKKEFRSITIKMDTITMPGASYTFMNTMYGFMKGNLECFIKISQPPTYLGFLLLCALVVTYVSNLFQKRQCYCIAKILSLCLTAVYYRCYDNFFRETEKSRSLGSYCQMINSSLSSEDGKTRVLENIKEEGRSFIWNINHICNVNIFLTNFEKKLLYDTLDLVAAEGNLPDHEVTSTTPCEINSSLTDASNRGETMNRLKPRDAVVCILCHRRCFKYLEAFHVEIWDGGNSNNNH